MYAVSLISYNIPPLKLSDSGEKALNWMNDFHIRHLPVVEHKQLVGILSEDEVLNFDDPDLSIAESEPRLLEKFVYGSQHLYDAMQLVVNNNLTVIPVLNPQNEYLGIITLEGLIQHLANTTSITHPGGVLILEMDPRDYSLGKIAQLIESEKAHILSSFISSPYGTTAMELTLKINKQDLKHIAATMERFGYTVKSTFDESDYLDSLQDRYDALMRYLNV